MRNGRLSTIMLPGPISSSARSIRPSRPSALSARPTIKRFGWAIGEYMWSIVSDAGEHLGARPVGVDALAPIPDPLQESPTHA